jgi:hypothetical protein
VQATQRAKPQNPRKKQKITKERRPENLKTAPKQEKMHVFCFAPMTSEVMNSVTFAPLTSEVDD